MQAFGTSPADSLHEELEATHRLLQILKQEQARLVEADIDGLTALTEEKARIVARMSELARSRHSALAAAGFAAAEEGMQEWLRGPDATAAIGKCWKELLALAQSGKEVNRTNGLLIARHMTRNQTALTVLQGSAHGGTFYGPDGQATSKPGGRSLVLG